MEVGCLQELLANCLASVSLEQNVVGHDNGSGVAGLQQRMDMLHEVQLLV